MAQARYSKQRDCILTDLRSRYDHPTAEMVYENVKKIIPNISLGTVYRNLSQLSDAGEIMKISCGDVVHFDGNTNTHYHLYCVECNSIHDIDIPTMPALDFMASQAIGTKILGHDVIFKWKCDECRKRLQKNA